MLQHQWLLGRLRCAVQSCHHARLGPAPGTLTVGLTDTLGCSRCCGVSRLAFIAVACHAARQVCISVALCRAGLACDGCAIFDGLLNVCPVLTVLGQASCSIGCKHVCLACDRA